jgi:hypothetical protein
MASLLYRVSATDPITFGSVGIVLLGVAVTACYIPAAVPCAWIPWRPCGTNS